MVSSRVCVLVQFWLCLTPPSQWKALSEKVAAHSAAGLPPSKLLPVIRRAVRDTHSSCGSAASDGLETTEDSLGGRVFDCIAPELLRDIQSLKPNYCQSEFMEAAIRHQIRNRRPFAAAILAGSNPHLQRFAFGLLRRTYPKETWLERLKWTLSVDCEDGTSDEVVTFQPDLQLSEGFDAVGSGGTIHVVVIHDVPGLLRMIPLLSSATVVGLDAEWRPRHAHSPVKQWPVSIVQIALPHVVFIVDLLSLHALASSLSAEVAEAVDASVGTLFRGSCVKAGFGIVNDLKLIAATHPSWFPAPSECSNVLEVRADSRVHEGLFCLSSLPPPHS
jgi:hypothetical protein